MRTFCAYRTASSLLAILFVLCLTCLPSIAQTANPTLNEAIVLHRDAQLDSAIAKYQQVVITSKDPTEMRHARFAIAACLFSLKQYDTAITTFEQFAKDFPDDWQAPLAIVHAGNCVAEQGRLEDAMPYYAKALQIQQSSENMVMWLPWAHLGVAKVLMNRQDYSDALAHLKLCVSEASWDQVTDEATKLLWQCRAALAQSGTPDNADLDAKASLALGRKYEEDRKLDLALPLLQQAASEASDGNIRAEASIKSAVCLHLMNRDADALAAVQAVYQIQDQSQGFLAKRSEWSAQAKCWEARLLLEDSKNCAVVIRLCTDALSAYSDAERTTIALLKCQLADALEGNGQLENAIGIYRELRSQNISEQMNVSFDTQIGDSYRTANRYGEAIETYKLIKSECTSQETNARITFEIALCYWKSGDNDKARGSLQEITSQYSTTTWKSSADKALATWFTSPGATN